MHNFVHGQIGLQDNPIFGAEVAGGVPQANFVFF